MRHTHAETLFTLKIGSIICINMDETGGIIWSEIRQKERKKKHMFSLYVKTKKTECIEAGSRMVVTGNSEVGEMEIYWSKGTK